MSPPALLTRYGVIIFRVVSAPAGLSFVVAVALMASGASAAVARRFRVTLRHAIGVHLQLRQTDSSQARLQTVLPWPNSMARTRNGGSHAGLYAARMYRQDHRRLLRRLRRSRGCSPFRSSSGFGGGTRPCRRAWPHGGPSGAGISTEAEKQQSHDGLYAATVPGHDHRWLLRRLRQSSGCGNDAKDDHPVAGQQCRRAPDPIFRRPGCSCLCRPS